jgi:hypothetical protein
MPEKLSNSLIYSLIALVTGIIGVTCIAVLRYLPAGSIYELLFSVLGVSLIVVASVFVFFFFTMQWRWTQGQPQPRSMG